MKTLTCLAVLTIAFGGGAASSWAAPITYTINNLGVSGAQATGTITTDGTTGILAATDITSWNIAVIDGGGHTFTTMTPLNSTVGYGNNYPTPRNPLTATATALNFNFSDTYPSDYFSFNGPLGTSLCYGNSACAFGATADYMAIALQQSTYTSPALTGVQAIATASTSSTPEPRTALLVLGALAVFLVQRTYRGSFTR